MLQASTADNDAWVAFAFLDSNHIYKRRREERQEEERSGRTSNDRKRSRSTRNQSREPGRLRATSSGWLQGT